MQESRDAPGCVSDKSPVRASPPGLVTRKGSLCQAVVRVQ